MQLLFIIATVDYFVDEDNNNDSMAKRLRRVFLIIITIIMIISEIVFCESQKSTIRLHYVPLRGTPLHSLFVIVCTLVSAKDSSDISTNEDSDKYFSEYELASSSDGWQHPWSFDRNISSESSPHQPDVDTVCSIDSGKDTVTPI